MSAQAIGNLLSCPLIWMPRRTTVTAQTSLYDSADRLVAQTTQVQAVR